MPYNSADVFWQAETPVGADVSAAARRRAIVLHHAAQVADLADELQALAGFFDVPIDRVADHLDEFGAPPLFRSLFQRIGLGGAVTLLAIFAAYDRGWGVAVPRERGDPLAIANWFLRTRVAGRVGTDTSDYPLGAGGDYDMPLVLLNVIALRYSAYLTPAARGHLVDRLLTQRGRVPSNHRVYGGLIPETENHLLNIETSRYLTNQLLGRDNDDLGVRQYLSGMLSGFLRNDFEEYNARPYQNYAVRAIAVLHEHAADPGVAQAARMVLDYLSFKFAVSSSELRRHVPFRRRAEHTWVNELFHSDADNEAPRFMALTGMGLLYTVGDPQLDSLAGEITVPAVVGPYRPPLAAVDLLMNPAGRLYQQRFRHAGVEVFASTPEYLFSAGGIWMESVHGCDELPLVRFQDVSVPTEIVFMPAAPRGARLHPDDGWKYGVTRTQLLAITGTAGTGWGEHRSRIRNSTGVVQGFASGLNIRMPSYLGSYAHSPTDPPRDGRPLFIDGTSLPIPQRYYLAVWIDDIPADDPAAVLSGVAGKFGWILAERAADGSTFEQFEQRVVSGGGRGRFTWAGLNHFPGPDIWFTPFGDPGNKYHSPIRLPDGGWIDMGAWPLAAGDVLNSEGHRGVIHIDHPIFGVLGADALRRRRIAGPGNLREELSRHGISAGQGLRGALAGIIGVPPSARTSTRTALSLLRRRLTLDLSDGGAPRRRAPRYTAREAMLLLGADPGLGLRQLFAHERGLRTIRLSEFVGPPASRHSVRSACALLGVDPSKGLLRAFPLQSGLRGRPYALSSRLRD